MVEIVRVKNFDELSNDCARRMLECIKENPKANICLASGGSPELAYRLFAKQVIDENIDVHEMTVTKLDEWVNVSSESDVSCEKYIRDRIVKPLGINDENFISFLPDAKDSEKEAQKVEKALEEKPIDLCILGFGKNGHLGLNEPSDYLTPYAHVINLDEKTKTHPMLQGNPVEKGMTIGMKNILDAKEVVLLMSGEDKQDLFEAFMEKKISTHLPASFLWLHNNLKIVVREDQFQFSE